MSNRRKLPDHEAIRMGDFYATEVAKLGQLWTLCTDQRVRAVLREIIAEAEEAGEKLRRGEHHHKVRT